MMKQDLKISLPVYKIGYSLAFIVILSCVHSVVYVNEIGPAIDGKMAVLTLVFCADTYLIERQSRRREVFRLYLIKNQYYCGSQENYSADRVSDSDFNFGLWHVLLAKIGGFG